MNRLPMEQREPTGPAMQGCDRASDLKVGYFLLEEFVVRSGQYWLPQGRQCVFSPDRAKQAPVVVGCLCIKY